MKIEVLKLGEKTSRSDDIGKKKQAEQGNTIFPRELLGYTTETRTKVGVAESSSKVLHDVEAVGRGRGWRRLSRLWK